MPARSDLPLTHHHPTLSRFPQNLGKSVWPAIASSVMPRLTRAEHLGTVGKMPAFRVPGCAVGWVRIAA
jgi:hypothetical protein